MKHSGIKFFIAALFLFATASVQKAEAQFYTLWDGDLRLGLSAGLGHNFSPCQLQVPTGYTLDEATTPAITPSFGLYSGREQEINRNFSFGFDGRLFYNKLLTNATLKDAAGTAYGYKFSAHNIGITENIYLAYEIMDETQANLGIGIFERFMIGSKAESLSVAATAPECGFGDMSTFAFDFGLDISAGLTYYLGDSFFVKGSVDALIPLYSSTKFFDDTDDGWGYSSNSSLIASLDGGFNLGFNVVIGFKW